MFKYFIFRKPKIIIYDDSSDDSLSEGLKTSRRNYIKDEINALERTLGKRRAQLKNADKLLKECNNDLMDAREQVLFIIITTVRY